MARQAHARVTYQRLRTILIVLGIAVASVWLLEFLWGLGGNFGALVVTLLLAWIINLIALKPVRLMRRRRIPRALAATIVYLVIAGITALSAFFILPPLFAEVGGVARNLTDSANDVPQILENLRSQLLQWGVPTDTVTEVIDGFISQISSLGQEVGTAILSSAGSVLGGLGLAILTLIISFYILLGWDSNLEHLRRELPADWRARFDRGIRAAERTFGGWLGGQTVASTVWGGAVVLIYFIADMPFGVLVAVATGLLMFIPFVGLAIGIGIPIVMAVTLRVDLAISVGISLTIISLIIENIIKPRVMGTALGVNPLVVILSVIVGGEPPGFGEWFSASPSVPSSGRSCAGPSLRSSTRRPRLHEHPDDPPAPPAASAAQGQDGAAGATLPSGAEEPSQGVHA